MAKSMLRLTTSMVAEPRNGTCTHLMPERTANNSPDRCGVVPTPEELKVTPCGWLRAQTRNSASVRAGCSFETTKTLQFSQKVET